jgi:hypothetical protein
MCLACAIPIRGRIFGAECLGDVLGEDAPPAPVPDVERPPVSQMLTAVGFGLAAIATLVSWSRYGAGSGAFGAWSTSFRWSIVCGVAAVAGAILSVMRLRTDSTSRGTDVANAILAIVVVVTGVFAIARPPAFSAPWLGPYIAITGGVIALVGGVATLQGSLRRNARADV